ncbi:MAG: hypothetical protein RLZZ42_483 [Bacteroidota bacterium]
MKTPLKWLFVFASIAVFSCKEGKSHFSNGVNSTDTLPLMVAAGKFSTQTQKYLDSSQLAFFFKKYKEFLPYRDVVSRFYRKRNWQLAWFDSTGRVEQVVILYNTILSMEENGIPYEVHYQDDYFRTLEMAGEDSLSWQELMFTSQYLHFAEKKTLGLSRKVLLDNEWYIPKKRLEFENLIQQMLVQDDETGEKLIFFQYELLRKKLGVLNSIEKNGGWTIPESTNKTFRKGDTGRLVQQIRKRLMEEGVDCQSEKPSEFDQKLEDALKIFQGCHGLHPDGVAGKKTLSNMRIDVKKRIEQVMVNMERCRWLPIADKSNYIIVNVPEYKLHVMANDSTLFSMPAIVGKETNKTTIFMGKINEIVINPYWNIPKSILEKEILPLVRKNPHYLESNNMEWHNGQLRQKPGPDNALGKIKFLFPNPFNIYLHDTPGKHLFEREKRSFSHGCIRIGAPIKLASFLLADEKGWTEQQIAEKLSETSEYSIHLSEAFPVYIVYLTAFVDANGRLNFREDLYNRDNALGEMLLKK